MSADQIDLDASIDSMARIRFSATIAEDHLRSAKARIEWLESLLTLANERIERLAPEKKPQTKYSYWVSWFHLDAVSFEYDGPWWVTGVDSQERSLICAAVRAESEDAARRLVLATYMEPLEKALEWRFVHAKSDDWNPFSPRFPPAEWMKWQTRDEA